MQRFKVRVVSLVLLCVAMASGVHAELASVQEMDNVAHNWVTEMTYKKGTWAGVTDPTISGVHEITQDGRLLARVYDLSPRGYVVVPALKELGPIKVYSEESNLDVTQDEGMTQLLREVLSERMELFLSAYGDLNAVQPSAGEVIFDQSQKAAWDRLKVTEKEFRVDQSSSIQAQAGPLLTSSWHQRAPYNDICPMGDGGRCVVGCTATSLSQILDYWEWPTSGVGSHSYLWGGDGCNGGWVPGYEVSADFSDAYDWANIPDSCDGVEGCTPAQEAALAQLCHEAGVSVNMNYGACGSGANMDMAVFPIYFKYSASIAREYRSDHTQQSWYDLIQSEIDAGRVMWYGINSHAIVCDGYRDNGGQLEYHMNYGWGQANNAWYVLDNLYCYWIEGDVCPYDQDFLTYNIQPQYTADMRLISSSSSDYGDLDGLIESGESALATVTVQNNGNTATNAIGTLSTTDPYVQVMTPTSPFDPSFEWGEQSQTVTPFTFDVDPSCPDPHWAVLDMEVSTDEGYLQTLSFPVFIGNKMGWSDDMESGVGYWTHTGLRLTYNDEWHLETARAHSGTTSWKAGGPGYESYANSSDGALVTPPFRLPVNAQLKFWHWMLAENDAGMTAWDGGIVMISGGDGIWTQIHPVGGYPYTIIENDASPFAPGTPCFSGYQDWSEVTFDLSEYSGVVQLMFRFGVDGYVTFEGWYVDDVWVGNTAEGASVMVSPMPGLTLTFESVITRGTTAAMVGDTGPVPPEGYAPVPAAPAEYCDVSTDAAFSGNVTVCLDYDETDLTRPETELALFHYEDGSWVDATTFVNTETNQICGTVTSLSPFLLAERTSCCVGRVGDANAEGEFPDEITLGDIMMMVDVLFISNDCSRLACPAEADINQSGGSEPICPDDLTLGDIMTLVDFLFITGPENATLPDCL